jgi:energy-converting hydrogenase Eha subunit E
VLTATPTALNKSQSTPGGVDQDTKNTTDRESTRFEFLDPRIAGVVPAALISIAYLTLDPASADFASGDFRARLFRKGAYIWDNHWFGGHTLPGYGIVSPMLSGPLGVVPVAIASLVVASWAFGSIVAHWKRTRPNLPSPTLASMLFSVGCGLSLWGGRLTFGPAVAFGVLCVFFLQRQRPGWAVVAALLCGLSSPVGALSLAIVLVACWLAEAFSRRALVFVGAAAIVPAGIVGLTFPEGGWYPFTFGSLLWLSGVLAVIAWFGRRDPVVRMLALVYAAVAIGAFVIRSPLGGNVVRLAWLAAAPAAVLTATRFRRTLLPMFVIFTVIWGWSYVRLGFVAADATTQPKYYDSLAAFVQSQPGAVKRVEVVATESSRQADELALKISIARGWETQLDRELNPEFYNGLTAESYHGWLNRNSVSLVALPTSGLRQQSQEELAVIEARPSYLKLVWSNPQWRVYRVVDSTPLADNGATVTGVGTESLTVYAPHVGVTNVRFRYTKWYQIATGDACVTRSDDGWLQLHVRTPGTVIAKISFTLGTVTGDGHTCT